MGIIELKILGTVDATLLEATFGKLRTREVVITDERILHIKEHHPQDYEFFELYGAQTIADPDYLLQDVKHTGTVFAVRKLENTNLNIVLRLALETDDPTHKNSVMTFYRIRERNLVKLMEKNPLLYKRE